MEIAMAIIKIIWLLLNLWTESNEEKKKKKAEALKEATNGIANNDPSAITAAFDKFNRI